MNKRNGIVAFHGNLMLRSNLDVYAMYEIPETIVNTVDITLKNEFKELKKHYLSSISDTLYDNDGNQIDANILLGKDNPQYYETVKRKKQFIDFRNETDDEISSRQQKELDDLKKESRVKKCQKEYSQRHEQTRVLNLINKVQINNFN